MFQMLVDPKKRNREPLNDSLSLSIFDNLRDVTGTQPMSLPIFDNLRGVTGTRTKNSETPACLERFFSPQTKTYGDRHRSICEKKKQRATQRLSVSTNLRQNSGRSGRDRHASHYRTHSLVNFDPIRHVSSFINITDIHIFSRST